MRSGFLDLCVHKILIDVMPEVVEDSHTFESVGEKVVLAARTRQEQNA